MLLLLVTTLSHGETALGNSAEAAVDWATGRVVLTTRVAVAGQVDPRTRFRILRDLDRGAPEILLSALNSLTVDSWYTLRQLVEERRELIDEMRDFSLVTIRETSHYTTDLTAVEATHSLPLFGPSGLISHLITHKNALPTPDVLGAVAQIPATGLIIYAARPLPAYGTDRDATPVPAIFPRIFDEEMNLVLDREMCDPDALRKWGMVAYTTQTDERPHFPRIGPGPMRILARGVFGRNGTDLMIPTEAARRLLGTEQGRQILTQGRILVVYNQTNITLD
jgi:hypothetical protein